MDNVNKRPKTDAEKEEFLRDFATMPARACGMKWGYHYKNGLPQAAAKFKEARKRRLTAGTTTIQSRTRLRDFSPEALAYWRERAGFKTAHAAAGRLAGLPYTKFEKGEFTPFIDSRSHGDSPVHRICELFGIEVSDLQKPPPAVPQQMTADVANALLVGLNELTSRLDRLEEWIRS